MMNIKMLKAYNEARKECAKKIEEKYNKCISDIYIKYIYTKYGDLFMNWIACCDDTEAPYAFSAIENRLYNICNDFLNNPTNLLFYYKELNIDYDITKR